MTTRRLQDLFAEAVGVIREAVELEAGELPVSPTDLEELSQDASEELPDAIRQVFSAEALVEGAVPGWEKALEELRGAAGRFFAGKRGAIAITGQADSGRGALLDVVEELAMELAQEGELLVSRIPLNAIAVREGELSAHLGLALGLQGVESAAQLQAQLLAGPRRVILIERAHNLYLRKIGGFDALREGLALLGETQDHVLWVLEFDAFAWNYLDALFQVSSSFHAVVEAPLLDAADLRAVFERQIGTLEGSTFKFLPLRSVSAEQRDRWRSELYWDHLQRASHGNPRAASQLFCQGLRWSEHLKTGWLLPPRVYPFERVLASFPRPALLALALTLEHEALSPGQLAELLLLSRGEALAILDACERYSVMLRHPSGNRYSVNPPWIAAIREHLSEWNIL